MAATGKCLINARNLGEEIKKWSNLPKVKKTFKNIIHPNHGYQVFHRYLQIL